MGVDAEKGIVPSESLSGQELNGRALTVNEARPKSDREMRRRRRAVVQAAAVSAVNACGNRYLERARERTQSIEAAGAADPKPAVTIRQKPPRIPEKEDGIEVIGKVAREVQGWNVFDGNWTAVKRCSE